MVIASGVSAGEVVVTDGQLRLTPGARVAERGERAGRLVAERAGAGARPRAADGRLRTS